jgi:hypothetical protein
VVVVIFTVVVVVVFLTVVVVDDVVVVVGLIVVVVGIGKVVTGPPKIVVVGGEMVVVVVVDPSDAELTLSEGLLDCSPPPQAVKNKIIAANADRAFQLFMCLSNKVQQQENLQARGLSQNKNEIQIKRKASPPLQSNIAHQASVELYVFDHIVGRFI